MTRLCALVLKDLYLYRLELVLSWLCAVAVICGGFWWKHPGSPEYALVVIGMFNLIFMMAYGDWLAYFERSKGTFTWLRTLPLSDELVVTAKFVSGFVMQSVTFFLPVIISVPELLTSARILWTLTAWIALLTMSSFMLFTKLMLGRRFGQVVPFVTVFMIGVTGVGMSSWLPDLWGTLVEYVLMPPVLIFVELLIVVALWQVMCRWISARDTPQLID